MIELEIATQQDTFVFLDISSNHLMFDTLEFPYTN